MLKKCSEKQFVCMFLLAHKMFWYLKILNFLIMLKSYVTSFINRAVIPRFSADSCFEASADHHRIFSTLNRVVKVKHQTSAGHRQATARRLPDSLCGWPKFRAMPRRRSAGGPAVTAGAPAGRRRMPRNPPIIGRSPFGHRVAIEGFDTDVIWTWTFNICMIIVIVHNFYC